MRTIGDAEREIAKVEKLGAKWLTLRQGLYPPLLSERLIDRLVLITFPIVLGHGKRIFDGSVTPGAMKLVDHFVSDKGVVLTVFEPAGDVPTGSFATEEPSAAELERREKIEAGAW